MIGVGLFITIIVIAAVMLITGMGQDLLNSGTQQLSSISTQLQSQLTQEFDTKVMTGAQVLSAVKQYYNSNEISIVVRPYKNDSKGYSTCGLYYLDVDGSYDAKSKDVEITKVVNDGEHDDADAMMSKTPLAHFSDRTSDSYISSNVKFMSKLIYYDNDKNNAILGILFVRI